MNNEKVSSVGRLNNFTTDNTSSIVIGDTVQFTPVVHAIAVQRERAIFIGDEFRFTDYSLFSRPLPQPVVTEGVVMHRWNQSPQIEVQSIDVFNVSGSSLLQIGSIRLLRAERRVKNIRHLLREPQ